MFRVSREIDFCYGHRLLNYDGKCKHLHGHNGRAVITIESLALDERGMVLDFSDIKHVISNWIDENLDHRMILHRDDPARAALEALGEPLYLIDNNPTAENIAIVIWNLLEKKIPACSDHGAVKLQRVRLIETARSWFDYYGK